jgi:PKD repeat protein
MGSTSSEMGGAIAVTNGGEFIIAASTGGFGAANRDVWLLKLDADGNEQWSRVYDGVSGAAEAAMDEAHAVVQTPGGGFVVAGVSDRPVPSSAGDLLSAFLIRTDSTGTELWRRQYGENSLQDHARSLALTDESLVLAGATTDAVTMRTNAYVVATALDGTELWRQVIGGDQLGWGNAVAATSGAVTVAGFSESESAAREAWVFQVSTLLARFGVMPSSGHAPLSVQFSDQSLGAATAWSWDLDGDGSPESSQRNPMWTYDTPGVYTVSLTVTDNQSTSTATLEGCIRVFDGESALDFDGQSGSATSAASPSLSFADAVTVEALIKPRGWGESSATGYGRIVDKTSFAMYLHGEGPTYNDHSVLFMIKNPSGPPKICSTPPHSIELDQWQHVAVTYDSAAGVSILVDGQPQELTQSAVPSGPIRDNAGIDLFIGNAPSDNVTFDGVIDEVRVWHIVRSAEDIQRCMHGYLTGEEGGLAGCWSMNEGWGDSLNDGSPNRNNALIINALWAQGGVTPASDPTHPPVVNGDPDALAILCSAPNPFTGSTAMSFGVPTASVIDVAVFDLAGRKVRQALRGALSPGTHVVRWDGLDDLGRRLASGPYVWVVRAGDARRTLPVIASR